MSEPPMTVTGYQLSFPCGIPAFRECYGLRMIPWMEVGHLAAQKIYIYSFRCRFVHVLPPNLHDVSINIALHRQIPMSTASSSSESCTPLRFGSFQVAVRTYPSEADTQTPFRDTQATTEAERESLHMSIWNLDKSTYDFSAWVLNEVDSDICDALRTYRYPNLTSQPEAVA